MHIVHATFTKGNPIDYYCSSLEQANELKDSFAHYRTVLSAEIINPESFNPDTDDVQGSQTTRTGFCLSFYDTQGNEQMIDFPSLSDAYRESVIIENSGLEVLAITKTYLRNF